MRGNCKPLTGWGPVAVTAVQEFEPCPSPSQRRPPSGINATTSSQASSSPHEAGAPRSGGAREPGKEGFVVIVSFGYLTQQAVFTLHAAIPEECSAGFHEPR